MGVNRFILAGLLLLGGLSGAFSVEQSGDNSSIEIAMANRIEPLVKQIGGVSQAWVWVKIETDLERWRAFLKTLSPNARAAAVKRTSIPRSVDVLPGVNTDEMAGLLKRKEQSANTPVSANRNGRTPDYESAVKMASWFQTVSVRIAVPSTIAPDRLAALKTKLPTLIGLHLAQGDSLVVETVPDTAAPVEPPPSTKTFSTRLLEWLGQISPNMAIVWMCLVAAIFFFFGPIRSFLRDAAAAMQIIRVQSSGSIDHQSRIKQEQDLKSETLDKTRGLLEGRRLALGAGTPEEPEILNSGSSPKTVTAKDLFSFINEETMTNLLQICQQETAEHIAMLASYLKPAWASRLVSSLPTTKRQDVLGHFTQESRFKPEEVTAFSKRLESTIYFVSGGPDRLLELLEEMEPVMRDAVLVELDRLLPETARIVRSKFVTYLDLFRIEAKDLQKVLWEAYRQKISLAVLFAAVSPKGQEYLIKQLPDSIADILRADVKALGTPSVERVDTEGRRLLHLGRTLEKNGDIGPISKISGEAA